MIVKTDQVKKKKQTGSIQNADNVKMLQTNLNRYCKEFIDSSREAFFLISSEGLVTSVNNAALQMLDYSLSEIPGLKAESIFPNDYFSKWLTNISKAGKDIEDSSLYINNLRTGIITKDDYKVPVVINCKPATDSKKGVIGGIVAATDMSESIYLERALYENEEKIRNISEFANDAIIMMDHRGRINFWNNSAKLIFGYSQEEVLGVDLHTLLAPEKYHESFMSASKKFIQTGEGNAINTTVEISAIRKSGKEFPIELSLSAYRVRNKYQAIGVIRDISKRKEAEKKLKESEEFHRTMIETSPNAIVTTDVEGVLTFVSDRTYSLFKVPEGTDLIGKSIIEYVHPGDIEKVIERFGELITGSSKPGKTEVRLICLDGSEIVGDISSSPILKQDNTISGLYLNIHDVTERSEVLRELREAKKRSEESDRLKEAFIRNISHEIRTPMNALVGFGELLNDPELSEDDRKLFSENIATSTRQLLSVISVIVDMSGLSAGVVRTNIAEVCPCEILEDLKESFTDRAEKNNLRVKLNIDINKQEKMLFYSDGVLLKKALGHIIDNAIKFTKKGEVELGIFADNKKIIVSVRDTGIGIPAEHVGRIFEPFYQVDNGMTKTHEGSGLGLSVAKGFIELLGGSLEFKSEPGRGSLVTLKFNRKVPDDEISLNGKDKTDSKQVLVLVAEDNDSNYELIRNYLRDSNTRLVRANNGSEAVAEVCESEHNFSFVLMDLHMPIMDGIEATKRIREINQDVVIIAQSAYPDEKDRSLSSGCNSFISKPFTKKQLMDALKLKISIC